MASEDAVLPDFAVLSRAQTELSREFNRYDNMNDLRTIIEEIRRRNGEPRHHRDCFVTIPHFKNVRKYNGSLQNVLHLHRCFYRSASVNQNSVARLHNSKLFDGDHDLMPLRAILTSEPS